MTEISVALDEILREQETPLGLRLITGDKGLQRVIKHPRLQKPSLAFAGFIDHLDDYCMQVIGQTELEYLATRSAEQQLQVINDFFDLRVAAVVLTRNIDPPEAVFQAALRTQTPLLVSTLPSTIFMTNMMLYLSKRLAPVAWIHGTFLDVFGQGLILRGESGTGKSEIALELVTRGHRLIADDIIEFRRETPDTLVGRCPEASQDFLEVRGLGFINVRHLFGSPTITRSKKATLVIDCIHWQNFSQDSRIDDVVRYETIHGVRLPVVAIPVRPGRSMAVLVEVATRSHSQRELGLDDHHLFIQGLNARLSGGEEDE